MADVVRAARSGRPDGSRAATGERFRHEALFYAGDQDFVDRTSAFIEDAVREDEPVLVVVGAAKIDMLRSALGPDAGLVRFADMGEVGRNPARIIPAWREFVAEHAAGGRRFRGLGEPVWAGRSRAELVECERHEALLNLAFATAPGWWLVCPYDTNALDAAVIEEAERNHPVVRDRGGVPRPSAMYRDLDDIAKPFDRPLPEPRGRADEMSFDMAQLDAVRNFVSGHAAGYGMDPTRTEDLVFSVNEVATNSLRHGGGSGALRMWPEEDVVICEVRDGGRIADPLVGRQRPAPEQEGGFGLWLANHLCDLVQVRTLPAGSVVRLHMARR